MSSRPACLQGCGDFQKGWRLASAKTALGDCVPQPSPEFGHADAYAMPCVQERGKDGANCPSFGTRDLAASKEQVQLFSLCLFRAQSIPQFFLPPASSQLRGLGKPESQQMDPQSATTQTLSISPTPHARTGWAGIQTTVTGAREWQTWIPPEREMRGGKLATCPSLSPQKTSVKNPHPKFPPNAPAAGREDGEQSERSRLWMSTAQPSSDTRMPKWPGISTGLAMLTHCNWLLLLRVVLTIGVCILCCEGPDQAPMSTQHMPLCARRHDTHGSAHVYGNDPLLCFPSAQCMGASLIPW